MNQLINYIKINGNKTYKEMPFNEIDAVIYTMISYVDFRGILTKPMAIKDVYGIYKKKFVSKTKEKFIIANEKLFEIIASTKRYENNILEHYKSVEQTLQNTLIMAQQTADDIKANAQSRADQIIRDAQSEARRATDEIAKEEFEIRKRTEELKRQFNVYKAKMEALLISQLEMLQDNKENEE